MNSSENFCLQPKRAVSLLALLVTTACGGGGGGEEVVISYETLDSSASSTSGLGGVGIRSNDKNSDLEVVSGSGSLTHNTGALTYGDADYTLVDADGMTAGTASDGSGGTLSEATDVYSGTYEFVIPATFSYSYAGADYTTTGFVGISTETADMPSGGSATYNGEAAGIVIAGADFFDLADGSSEIIVNFLSGDVDVTLDAFTVTDAFGTPVAEPLDTVKITNMTIAGNTFSGGALTTELSTAPVDLTGTNTASSSEGVFFGWDDVNLVPDEVAGVSSTVGDDGILQFTFVAD